MLQALRSKTLGFKTLRLEGLREKLGISKDFRALECGGWFRIRTSRFLRFAGDDRGLKDVHSFPGNWLGNACLY